MTGDDFLCLLFSFKRRLTAEGSGKKKTLSSDNYISHTNSLLLLRGKYSSVKHTTVKLLQNLCCSYGNIQPDFALVYNL